MQLYDVFMIGVLAMSTVLGAWKGAAWQVASIASLVVSYLAALRLRHLVAPYVNAEAPWNQFLAMLLIFILTSLLIWVMFRLVAGFIDRLRLKEFDRQLGGLLGAAKGVLLCVTITLFAVTLSEQGRELVFASRSGYYIALLLDRAHKVLPPEVHDVLHPYIHELDHLAPPHEHPRPHAAPARHPLTTEPPADRQSSDVAAQPADSRPVQ